MTLNCWPSLVENVHDLGYAEAVNKFEENNPDEGGYQYVLDDIYIETEIEVIGMTENRDIICNLLKSEMKGILLKETITNHQISFCDKLFSEISNRSLIDIEFMSFEDINIQLFNELFSANPYKCMPYELAGHFEYIDTINLNKLI